jgi:bla regulator protein BlaR1
MLAWMSYVIVVSLLLSLAALALEHSARIRQKPTRWLWGTSMTASLLVPLLVSSVSVRIPQLASVADPAMPQRVVAVRDMTASGLSPSGWVVATARSLSASPDLDRLLQVGWSAASAILLLAIVASSVQLNRRRRHWKRGSMADVPVHISEDAGPAIVGLLDAHIVVPRWLLQCPPDVQELVIAHEQSHLKAHDAWLVTMALGLLVCMPWNLPLWWQLRRLRFAIEIDCDARILRRGYDVSRYGETLIAVGERQSVSITMVAAMSEPRSLLEQRLRNMLRRKTRHAHATAVALACLGFAFAVGAAEISPPNKNDPNKSVSDESAGAQAPSDPQGYCVNRSADFYPYTGEPCKSGYQLGSGNCRRTDGRMVAVPRAQCVSMAGTVELPFEGGIPPLPFRPFQAPKSAK